MKDIPEGYIVHLTPVRLRVKVPEKHRDRSFFESAQEQLSLWPTVERVEVNPATASVLIHASDTGAFLTVLKGEGPFTIVEQASEPEFRPLVQVREKLTRWDEQVERWTGGQLNGTRASAFLGVGVIVAFQLARGKRLSAAVTLLLYSGGALQRWWVSARADRGQAFAVDQAELTPRQLATQMSG